MLWKQTFLFKCMHLLKEMKERSKATEKKNKKTGVAKRNKYLQCHVFQFMRACTPVLIHIT